MGASCCIAVGWQEPPHEYPYKLDEGGRGFDNEDMDVWSWQDLLEFVSVGDKPITQHDLDLTYKRYTFLCHMTLAKRNAGDGSMQFQNINQAFKIPEGFSFRELDPKFSGQFVGILGDHVDCECSAIIIKGLFHEYNGGTKKLSFVSFFTTCYKFCALPPHNLIKFILGIMGAGDEVDEETLIDYKYVIQMVEALYGPGGGNNKHLLLLLTMIPFDEKGVVEFGDFLRFVLVCPVLLYPLFVFQRLFRRKFLGDHFWNENIELTLQSTEEERSSLGFSEFHLLPYKFVHSTESAWVATAKHILLDALYPEDSLLNVYDKEEETDLIKKLRVLAAARYANVECMYSGETPVEPSGFCKEWKTKAQIALVEKHGYQFAEEVLKKAEEAVEMANRSAFDSLKPDQKRPSKIVVLVPDHAQQGAMFVQSLPKGEEVDVEVPMGVTPGVLLEVSLENAVKAKEDAPAAHPGDSFWDTLEDPLSQRKFYYNPASGKSVWYEPNVVQGMRMKEEEKKKHDALKNRRKKKKKKREKIMPG